MKLCCKNRLLIASLFICLLLIQTPRICAKKPAYSGESIPFNTVKSQVDRLISIQPDKAEDEEFLIASHVADRAMEKATEKARDQYPGIVASTRDPEVYQKALDERIIHQITEENLEWMRAQNKAARILHQYDNYEEAKKAADQQMNSEMHPALVGKDGTLRETFARKLWIDRGSPEMPETREEAKKHEENRLADILVRYKAAMERIEKKNLMEDAELKAEARGLLSDVEGSDPTEQEVEEALKKLLLEREMNAWGLEQLEKVENIPEEIQDGWNRVLEHRRKYNDLEQHKSILSRNAFNFADVLELAENPSPQSE